MPTMSQQFRNLLIRWAVNSFGLWLAERLIDQIDLGESLGTIIFAGFVLSIVNSVIKPAVVILSLPAILFSLGIFMVFINGLMVLLASALVSSFDVGSYGAAILAGLIIGLVNYVVTNLVEKS